MTSTDDYLPWLYEQVGLPRRQRGRSYWKLFEQMHSKEFVWVVMKDRARAEDGLELRWEFVQAAGLSKVPAAWMYDSCSILELMIALARRMGSMTETGTREWFTQLLWNLGVIEYTDLRWDGHGAVINEILECLVWRRYLPTGQGGLFPLSRPAGDQRQVEVWLQMNAWLIERSAI